MKTKIGEEIYFLLLDRKSQCFRPIFSLNLRLLVPIKIPFKPSIVSLKKKTKKLEVYFKIF